MLVIGTIKEFIGKIIAFVQVNFNCYQISTN